MKKIDKESPIPIYAQLQEIITEMIENEELQPHDPIPTEYEFCDFHEISRMTVRTAIMSLVNKGILYREQGKGTFVAPSKPKYQLSGFKGLTEGMVELGYQVNTTILSFQCKPCSKFIASMIGLKTENQAYRIERLRLVDRIPYAIETVWLHPDKYPNLTKEMLDERSLYEVIQNNYQLLPHYAKQIVEPVHLNAFEKKTFNLQEDALGLLFHRTTYTEDDTVIEYTKSIYRVDQHKFEMHLNM